MRLRQWLTPKLALLGKALSACRINAQAVVFGVSCWLVFSGVSEFSPPAARITLGAMFLMALLWPEPKKGRS